MAFVLLVYTGESVALTFFVAAGMFGAVALYGTVTTRSLAGVGQFMFMGLIGLVLASVVGIFWRSDALQFLIAFIGVIVFTGLAAWDAQRLKAMALSLPDGRVGLIRGRRRAVAVPRLHQPVPVAAAVDGQPAGLNSAEGMHNAQCTMEERPPFVHSARSSGWPNSKPDGVGSK